MTQLNEGSIVSINGSNFRVEGTTLVPTTQIARPAEFEEGQVWERDGEVYLLAEGGHTVQIDEDSGSFGALGCVNWEEESPALGDIFHGVGIVGITTALLLTDSGETAPAAQVAAVPASHAETGNTFVYGGITYTVNADGSATTPSGFTYDAATVARYIGSSTRVAQSATAATAHPQAGQSYRYGGAVFRIQPDGSAIDESGRSYDARTVAAYLPQARRVDNIEGRPAPRPGEQYEFGGQRYLITDNGGAVSLSSGSTVSAQTVQARVADGSARRVDGSEGGETYRVSYHGTVYTIHPDGSATDPSGRRTRADTVAALLPHARRL